MTPYAESNGPFVRVMAVEPITLHGGWERYSGPVNNALDLRHGHGITVRNGLLYEIVDGRAMCIVVTEITFEEWAEQS